MPGLTLSVKKSELKILTPIGMVGQGFSEQIFWDAIEDGVDAIIADSGSTDSGPGRLATGSLSVPRANFERDLGMMVKACHTHGVPILISSAGGDGENAFVDMFVEIITKLIADNGYRPMKVVVIYAEVPKDLAREKLNAGLISPCGGGVPPLLEHDIATTTRIVAQMGHEPYVKAMEENPDFDIIIGGRSYDPAPYAAFCLYRGFENMGVNYSMGKIMECGAMCSTPKSREALAIVRDDSFDIRALDPKSRCTVVSVASHFLYEKTRPDILHGPGGALLLSDTMYEQVDDRTVRVRGAKFEPESPGEYTLKLEGARTTGYQTVFIGAHRDPILLAQLPSFVSMIEESVKEKTPFDFDLKVHCYGQNGVMGALEPDPVIAKEVCICVAVRAGTQEQANRVASMTKFHFVHAPYPGQIATAGNFAWPFTPCEIPMGPLSEFCIYHIMHKSDPLALFQIKVYDVQGQGSYTQQNGTHQNGTHQNGASNSNGVKSKPPKSNGIKPVSHPATSTPSTKAYYLKPEPPAGTCYLGDLAFIVRSKNSGPYELTFDVMFDKRDVYEMVKETGILNHAEIARLYHISEKDVVASLFWDQAMAYKATIVRPAVSGAFGETDTHGSQQHVPLLYVGLPFGREKDVVRV